MEQRNTDGVSSLCEQRPVCDSMDLTQSSGPEVRVKETKTENNLSKI